MILDFSWDVPLWPLALCFSALLVSWFRATRGLPQLFDYYGLFRSVLGLLPLNIATIFACTWFCLKVLLIDISAGTFSRHRIFASLHVSGSFVACLLPISHYRCRCPSSCVDACGTALDYASSSSFCFVARLPFLPFTSVVCCRLAEWFTARDLFAAFNRRESSCIALVDCAATDYLVDAAAKAGSGKKSILIVGEEGVFPLDHSSATLKSGPGTLLQQSLFQARAPCCQKLVSQKGSFAGVLDMHAQVQSTWWWLEQVA